MKLNVEIDGKKLEVEQGTMIIEAADKLCIPIPRFCYHKKLPIAANCRMCLIEVEKVGKPLPACATPITDGMVVHTRSALARDAQKTVMEFLLINHPLDCPICDQGGECELQDIAVGYGKDVSRYTQGKRVVQDKDIGPLIATDLTRCIHCTRCVRFGTEVSGVMELGATGRGENMKIGTFIEKSVDSEVSGNVIDLCPVGALTSKPYRFTARAWELTQSESISPHDCLGSNLLIHSRRNKVMRVAPKDNEAINECWLSDRDRYSYEALNVDERLGVPQIKHDGVWRSASWEDALAYFVNGLKKLIEKDGVDKIGVLAHPSSTTEELYLLQKVFRSQGINNLDHRIWQLDFSDDEQLPMYPNFGSRVSDIEEMEAVYLVGSNIHKENPLLALRLRKGSIHGTNVYITNPADFNLTTNVCEKDLVKPYEMVMALAKVARACIDIDDKNAPKNAKTLLKDVKPSDVSINIAKGLTEAESSTIIIGEFIQNHPDRSLLIALCHIISECTKSSLGNLTFGANSSGAFISGFVPHRLETGKSNPNKGLTLPKMLENNMSAYFLHNIEPHLDGAFADKLVKACKNAKMVVATSSFDSESLRECADVIFPISAFTETSGTYINVEGLWQSFKGAVSAFKEARPAWKLFRVLGNYLEVEGFNYESSLDVIDELKAESLDNGQNFAYQYSSPNNLKSKIDKSNLLAIGNVHIYSTDMTVRHAKSLQMTKDAILKNAIINKATAKEHKLKDGDNIQITNSINDATLTVEINNCALDNTVIIPMAIKETFGLAPFGAVEIRKVKDKGK